MISFTENKEDIIKLWQNAFKDKREEILFFVDNVKDAECLAYYKNSEIASMMYLVKCTVNGSEFRYIYAACTHSKYKGRGYMTELIDYAKKVYRNLCLIPANDGLIYFYSKRGITDKTRIENIKFNQSEEIKEYLFEGYDLSEPAALIFKGGKI